MRRPLAGTIGAYELASPEEQETPWLVPVAESDAYRVLSSLAQDPLNLAILRQIETGWVLRREDTVDRLISVIEQGRLRLFRRNTETAYPPPPPAETPAPPEESPAQKQEKRLRKLTVRLAVDPADASSHDDLFVLLSTDGSYREEKTVKDDQTPGDAFVDLIYTDLDEELSYSLLHYKSPSAEPRHIFQAKPFWDITGVSRGKEPQKKRKKS